MDLFAYLRVYGIILLPTTVFVAAFSLALNVVLRNKHVACVVSIGTAAGLLYLYNTGHNHWLYNPAMFHLWSYAELTTPASLLTILWGRAYWLAAATVVLALAHLFCTANPVCRASILDSSFLGMAYDSADAWSLSRTRPSQTRG